MRSYALVEIWPHDDGDHCGECPFGPDEACGLTPDEQGNGRSRENDPDAHMYYRTRACLAAEAKAKGEGK